MIYLFMAFFTLLLTGFVFYKKMNFFMTETYIAAVFLITVAGFIYFGYCILLYLISRSINYRKNSPPDSTVSLKHLFFDFRDDFLTLFLNSIGFSILFAILLIPVFFLKSAGLFASALVMPLLSVISIIVILSVVLNNYICAYIAVQSNFFTESIKSMISFLFYELLNIPAFTFVITVTVSFVYAVLSSIVIFGLFTALSAVFLIMNETPKGYILPFISNVMLKFQGLDAGKTAIPVHASLGMIIIIVFIFLVLLLLKSLFINLMQSFYTEAVLIMKSNPGNSVHKAGVFTAMLLFFGALAVLIISYSYLVMQLIAKLTMLTGK
jgi:hypothetical protein